MLITLLIVFLPALLVLYAALRWDTRRAFLNVYLPTMFLLVQYFFIRFEHLPPLDPVTDAAFVLGICICFKDLHRWKFSLTDLWLAIYIGAAAFSDGRVGGPSAAFQSIFHDFSWVLVPYMAAKLLIEPNARVVTAKRIVWLLVAAIGLSMYEFFTVENPFRLVLNPYIPDGFPKGIFTQLRWGFGRVAGPYLEAELAGIIFMCGVVLAVYLGYWDYWEPKFKRLEMLPVSKAQVLTGIMVMALCMTLSRGPWIGLFLAGAVAYVGRSRKLTRKAVMIGLLLVAIGIPAYIGFNKYLDAPATSDEQVAAQYRKTMLTNYLPLAKAGGAFGWGYDYPKIWKQESIDNQYLLVDLTRGYIGLIGFTLASLNAWYLLLRAGMRATTLRDRHFAFTLLGLLSGLMFTIGTVFLGVQAISVYFLFIGWAQVLQVRRVAPKPAKRAEAHSLDVAQTLVKVYS
jgi:hypothetical protein